MLHRLTFLLAFSAQFTLRLHTHIYIHTLINNSLGYVSPRSGCQNYSSRCCRNYGSRFQRCTYWQSAAAQPLAAAAGSSSAVLGDAVVLLMVINDVIIPSSTTMWLISLSCVVPLYQLTRFRRLQCLIKLLLVLSMCYCVLNYDHKSADNVCLQLLAADCQERPLRNSNSAVTGSRFWPAAARTDIPITFQISSSHGKRTPSDGRKCRVRVSVRIRVSLVTVVQKYRRPRNV